MGRRAASPADAAALHDAILHADIRHLLHRADVPVLVLHRRSCASCDVGHARFLVDRLPDARLALLPGSDELWFTGDTDPLFAAIDDFLARLGPDPRRETAADDGAQRGTGTNPVPPARR
jgi:hypothetical protein